MTLHPDGLMEMMKIMLCAPQNALENPSYHRQGAHSGLRSFLVGEYGELDGYEGHWCLDEASGEQGLLAVVEDSFWVYDEAAAYWTQQRVSGRRLYGGKAKGKRPKGCEREGFL